MTRPPASGEPSTALDDVAHILAHYDISDEDWEALRPFIEARATPPALDVDERPCQTDCCDAQERRHIHAAEGEDR